MYTEDLSTVIVRMCELSHNAEEMHTTGRREYFKRVGRERKRRREMERAMQREREKERARRRAEMEGGSATPTKSKDGGMKMMSSRMGERADAVKTIKKKQLQHQVIIKYQMGRQVNIFTLRYKIVP